MATIQSITADHVGKVTHRTLISNGQQHSFTDATFVHAGISYGNRYKGVLSDAAIKYEFALSAERRRKEQLCATQRNS